jgi:GntR family transcriptional regulator of gluconate operon
MQPITQDALGDRIADRLRLLIVSGRLAHGEHLAEAALSEQFAVSRGPVRDALRILQAEDLVEARRRGVYVRGLRDVDILELYSLRQAIETLSLRLCNDAEPRPAWELFSEPVDAMRRAAADHDVDAYAKADLGFHTMFYTLAGHRRLLSAWNQYRPTFSALLQVSNAQDEDLGPSLASHELILSHMVGGNLDAAVLELENHFHDAASRILHSFRTPAKAR